MVRIADYLDRFRPSWRAVHYLLCVFAVLAASPARVLADAETWLFNGTNSGWTVSSGSSLSNDGNNLIATFATGGGLFSNTFNFVPASGANRNYIRFGYRLGGGNIARLRFNFQTAQRANYSSTDFFMDVTNDGAWHWTTFRVDDIGDWRSASAITKMRFIAYNSSGGGASGVMYLDFCALRLDDQVPYSPGIGSVSPTGWTNGGFTVGIYGNDPPPNGFNGSTPPDKYGAGVINFRWWVGSGGPTTVGIANYDLIEGWADATISVPTGSVAPGVNTFHVQSIDRVGHVGSSTPATLYYDPIPPATPGITYAWPGGWTNINDFYFEWSDPGDAHSYVASYQYRVNGGAPIGISGNALELGAPGDGANSFEVRAIDAAGNVGSWSLAGGMYLDRNPPGTPTITVASPSYWTSVNSFYFAWTNPGDDLSGIAYYEWVLDGTYPGYTSGTSTGLSVPWVGVHRLEVRAVDYAGNAGPWSGQAYIYFDNSPPDPPAYASSDPPYYTAQDNFTVSWPAGYDGDESGVAGYWYRIDGGTAQFTTSQLVSGALAGGQAGPHLFEVAAADIAGNTSGWVGTYFYYSPQWRPTIIGLQPSGPYVELPQTFSWWPTPQNGLYEMRVGPDPGFQNGVSTFYTYTPWVVMPSNAAPNMGQMYYWQVRDVYSTPPNWSPVGQFIPYVAPPPPPGQVIGQEFPSGEAADGVNTSLGAVTRSFTILTLRGPGGEVPLTAWYSSNAQTSGFLGPRWSWTLGQQLTPSPAVVTLEDNQQLSFTAGADTFVAAPGIYDSLLKVSGGGFELVRPSRLRLAFDQNGILQRILDRNQNAVTLAYQSGLLTGFTDQAGRSFTVSTQNTRVTQISDALGRTWKFEYAGGYLSAFTDGKGARTQFEFDGSGRLTRVVDPLGRDALRCTYDSFGRMSTQTDADGKVTTFTYDDPNRSTIVTGPLGGTLIHIRDANFRLVTDVNERGDSTHYFYDANSNRTAVRDGRGSMTRYEYDPRGNIAQVVDPSGDTTRTLFDLTNSPVSRIQPHGKVTTWVNDERGNPLTMTEPLGRLTTLTYNAAGQILTRTDANGHITSSTYDAQGNRTSSTNGAGEVTTYGYDAVGRRTSTTDALSHTTAFTYDGNDSLRTQTNALSHTTTYEYDLAGNRTALVDPRGFRTEYTFDLKNRLQQVKDPLGNLTLHAYDALDRTIQTTNPRGAVTTFSYDPVGNLTIERDALGNTETHAYDANRNRLTTINRLNKTTQFTYDAMNRVLTTIDPLGHTTANAYDSLGRLVSVTNPRGYQTRYVYDALDQLVAVQAPTGAQLQYGYDLGGNRTSTTNANGHTRLMTYDAADRLLTVRDPLGNMQSYAYDAVGRRIRRTDGRGRVTTYSYDAADRLVETAYDDNTSIQRGYDAAGNLVSLTDQWGSDAYTYDGLNRITASTDHYGSALAFAYDSTGNLVRLTYPGGEACDYAFDPLNRLTAVTDWGGRTVTYSYDAEGNNTGIAHPNGVTTSQTYDEADRLLSILTRTPGGDTLVSFAYTLDPNGNRTRIVRVDKREDPQRVPGSDVFAVSAALSANAFPTGTDSVVVASGEGWAEAIGAPVLARRLGVPTLIVPGENLWASMASQNELARLRGLRPSPSAILLGEIGGITPVVEAQLQQQGWATRRMVGANRFETAALAGGSAASPYAVLLGSGDFTRAGAAALLAARFQAPLLLTERDAVPSATQSTLALSGAARVILVGDETTIGESVANWLNANGHPVWKRHDSSDPADLSVAALEDSVPPDRYARFRIVNRSAYQDALSAAADPNPRTTATLLCGPDSLLTSPELVRWIGRHKGWVEQATLVGPSTALSANLEAELRNLLQTTGTEYTYNELDELTSEIIPGVDSTYYTYDLMGNRSSITHNRQATMYSYDIADRLISAGLSTYTYDGNGNRASRTENGSTTTYAYDFESRLTDINGSDGASRYRYDGLGRRIRAEEPNQTLRFTLDPMSKPYRTLREADDGGATLRAYVHGPGLVSEIAAGTSVCFYHFDGLGSTATITDSAAATLTHLGFTAFGDTALRLGSRDTRLGYVGRYGVEATASGLQFMRERFYDPETGLFLSSDPEPASPEEYLGNAWYLYADANPIVRIDPDGRWWKPTTAVEWLGRVGSTANTVRDAVSRGAASLGRVPFVGIGASIANEIANTTPGRSPGKSFQNAVAIGAVKGVGSFAVVTLGAGALLAVGVPGAAVVGAAIVGGYFVDKAIDKAAQPNRKTPKASPAVRPGQPGGLRTPIPSRSPARDRMRRPR